MISANDAEDFTEQIRNNKQSPLIKTDVNHLLFIKNKYSQLEKSDPEEFNKICMSQCSFLYNNYTDIFIKIKKDIIDLTILFKFLDILKNIEDGNMDQHEGSYKVGELLKQIYVDSALRKSAKNDLLYGDQTQSDNSDIHEPLDISYNQYKLLQKKISEKIKNES